jgi:hypothetical protein
MRGTEIMNGWSAKPPRLLGALGAALSIWGAVLLLSGCSPGGNSAIIGKWTEQNGAIHEFRADGTCSIGDPKSPLAGKYKSSGASQVTIELDGGLGKVVGTMDCKISAVQDNAFDLTYPDGEVHHLRKTK